MPDVDARGKPANIVIDLSVRKASGVLGRAGALLSRAGFRCRSHALRDEGEAGLFLRLEVRGEDVPDAQTLARIAALPDVLAVAEVRVDTPGPVRTAEDALAPRVAAIVRGWPSGLLALVREEEDGVAPRDRERVLSELGRRVGAALVTERGVGDPPGSVGDALRRVAVPLLDRVARTRVNGAVLEVPVSVFNRPDPSAGMDLVLGSAESPCYFLTGWIDGVLGVCAGLPEVRVEETRCRKHGDPFCEFKAILR